MERVLRKDIVDFLTFNSLWDKRQHGLRGGHSTLSQLLLHYNEIMDKLERKSNCDVIYLDFSKAYDKVDFSTLLLKIRALGIHGNIGSWIGSFLVERTQRVKVGDKLSEPETIASGVPQGLVLGPVFFLLYIQDMGLYVISSA